MSKLDKLQRLDLLGLPPMAVASPTAPIKLDEDESSLDWPEPLKAAYLAQLGTASWNRFPPGQLDLKRAIAASLNLTPEWVSLAAGADELVRNVLLAWCLRGTVVYPIPTTPLYGQVAQSLGIKHVAVMLRADFGLPLEQMIATARIQEAGVVLLANPNTPTGNLFARDEVLSLVRDCDSLVVVDESYIDFSGLTIADVLHEHENLAIIRTFSYAWRSAQFRLGYLLGHPRVVTELEKVRLPHNVGTAALLAGQTLLAHPEAFVDHWRALAIARERLRQALSQIRGVVTWPSAANFLLVGTTIAGTDLTDRLLDRGILVRAQTRSPLMNCIRVTVGSAEDNAAFLAAMREIFGDAT